MGRGIRADRHVNDLTLIQHHKVGLNRGKGKVIDRRDSALIGFELDTVMSDSLGHFGRRFGFVSLEIDDPRPSCLT